MSAYINFLNELTNKHSLQYPEFKNQIKWVGYYEALEKEAEREELIKSIDDKLNWSFKNTKPWINSLSKGCQLCGQGEWSCLFITGKCNANCFYCPASQKTDGIPSTQQTSFTNAEDYINYIDFFNFKGVSLSGGEPLIVFERTLEYITKIKKHFGDKIYLWMYTNGLLGNNEIYKKLADAGLDEVRFDIGASNYDLKFLERAKGTVPNLTVEIPAVPEELDLLKTKIYDLIDIGVTNLNLHQLRLTNYNAPKLLKKDYTYLHSEQASVLESELTALKIMEFVASKNFPIGINYCAFHFKNRFQKAGFRKKIASKFIDSDSQLSENGYLRNIKSNNKNYYIENNQIAPNIVDQNSNFEIIYKGLILDDNQNDNQFIKKIVIGNKEYFLRSGLAQNKIELPESEIEGFIKLFESNGKEIPEASKIFELWQKEFIEHDLRSYF